MGNQEKIDAYKEKRARRLTAAKRGQGCLVAFTVKLTPQQKQKLYELGGANWIRQQIEGAPNP
jgi:hypothetical protein